MNYEFGPDYGLPLLDSLLHSELGGRLSLNVVGFYVTDGISGGGLVSFGSGSHRSPRRKLSSVS